MLLTLSTPSVGRKMRPLSTSDDEKGVVINDPHGRAQETAVTNESGLYSLLLTSRKEAAKRFKKWITAEVIPSIRKTGSYGADPMRALNDPVAMRGLLLTYSAKMLALEAVNAELAPKAEALHRIAEADGSLCGTDAAKTLQVRPGDLFKFLRSQGWSVFGDRRLVWDSLVAVLLIPSSR